MTKKDLNIFEKIATFLSKQIQDETLIVYAFGSRVRGSGGSKYDYDVMVKTNRPASYCGKTLAKRFEKKNPLKDSQKRVLGKDVFIDIQFTSLEVTKTNSIILFKDGKIQG